MANLIAVTVYGSNQNDWNAPLGVDMAFPPSQIVCKTLPEDTYYSGVLCAASISLLPTAPSTIQPVYYTDSTVAELITAAG
jgi:hypothetical protein